MGSSSSPEGLNSYADLLKTEGSLAGLSYAASIVRQHAIATGSPASIRLVRVLKNAHSPIEIHNALAELRRWVEGIK